MTFFRHRCTYRLGFRPNKTTLQYTILPIMKNQRYTLFITACLSCMLMPAQASKNNKKLRTHGAIDITAGKDKIKTLQELLKALNDTTAHAPLKKYIKNDPTINKEKKGALLKLLNEIQKEKATPLMSSSRG